jgi:S-adenosylmethionine hydrolase
MITLLTDFGTQDVYVAVIKGVIASICPQVQTIDLTHDIPPQNLYAARFNLLNAVPYFPNDTIHMVVVDPGVGTTRRGVAVETEMGVLIGPDNGVMSGVWQTTAIRRAVELTNREYWRIHTPSTTFHGRDIFAPVAAHVARGVSLDNLGSEIDPASLQALDLPPYSRQGSMVRGTIQHIDHFGNGITTIPAGAVESNPWQVTIGPTKVPWGMTYGDVAPGHPLALIGSHGWVEIAVNQGSAEQTISFELGEFVLLRFFDQTASDHGRKGGPAKV